MERLKVIIILMFCFQIIQGQGLECDLLNKGIDYFEQGELDSALIIWESVVESFPDTSICYGRSFNNIPIVYSQLEKNEDAKKWYLKILESELNDMDKGDNLMAPYANYKHSACLRMANLFKTEKKYDESFKYIKLAETKFPYQTFSATSFEKRAVMIAFEKAEVCRLKGANKEALFTILEKILDNDVFFRKTDAASFTNVDFYSSLIKEMKPMIAEQYGIENFEILLRSSINQLEVEKIRIGKEKSKAKVATFKIEGREFIIGSSNRKYTKEDFKKRLLNNRLFESKKNKN